jgi:hypothetical protein
MTPEQFFGKIEEDVFKFDHKNCDGTYFCLISGIVKLRTDNKRTIGMMSNKLFIQCMEWNKEL